jgi:hypothetical protein
VKENPSQKTIFPSDSAGKVSTFSQFLDSDY